MDGNRQWWCSLKVGRGVKRRVGECVCVGAGSDQCVLYVWRDLTHDPVAM